MCLCKCAKERREKKYNVAVDGFSATVLVQVSIPFILLNILNVLIFILLHTNLYLKINTECFQKMVPKFEEMILPIKLKKKYPINIRRKLLHFPYVCLYF